MTWSLYEEERYLKPLEFSNGKTQQDIVKEVLEAIKKGEKIIFIHGVCGTGKSGIALNIARKLGKTSIVVPIKNLQEQYKKDYENNKYLLKENGQKMKINVITGRKNHKCKFLEDNCEAIPKITREINLKLQDIFDCKKEEAKDLIGKDSSADNLHIPCKIEIKEKNWKRINEYLKKNNKINPKNFHEIFDVKRGDIASICPYWSPVLPEECSVKNFPESKKKTYLGLKNKKFTFYPGKPGCGFYEQFNHYLDSDVIVFNSLKYKLETLLNRKPFTEVEIIDECDEFLDSFSDSKNIHIEKLQNALVSASWINEETKRLTREISEIIQNFKIEIKHRRAAETGEIIPLKETGIYDIFKILLNNSEFLIELDEESYIFEVEETARMFEDFLEDSYLTIHKKDDALIVSVVTTNLAKRFQDILNKNKRFILMSGTLHSKEVLEDIFGLKDFQIIDAEIQQQGQIKILKTGLEKDCKYSNFLNKSLSRQDYLKSLSKCLEIAKKPILIHVNGFVDLPTEQELKEFQIGNLISSEKLKEQQDKDKTGKIIEKFKNREIDILFSTKCSRGIDFPGEQCRSIIFTKYPNPNVQEAFWKILNKTKPQHYWKFYKDKARRELWQKVYRGIRFKDDYVYVLSPDLRVIEAFEEDKTCHPI